MSLLEKKITKKEQINELFLELKLEFDASNNKKYKIKVIKDKVIYAK